MRILLAEDERSLSRAVIALLEKNNYSADAVYDGQEALEYLEVGNYDALILDLMMPKMDGLTVLRTLREQGNPIPVLILTAKSEVDDKVLGLDTGANDYLTKPFSTQELMARIRAMTRSQAQRLTALTNDLIYLSRMEEEQPKLQYIDSPISDVVEEMAQSFAAPARSQDKDFQVQVQPMLSFKGDEKGIRQLVSILLDNALKYSPTGGQLALRLEKQGRNLLLTVSNTCAQPMEQDKLPHLFDRFYRTDQSRNSQSGGYGLGLSIAKSIVSAHKGKLRAESHDGTQLSIQVTLAAG